MLTEDIGVYALSNKDVTTIAISLSAGFAAVAGTVSVWTIGTQVNSNYSTDSDTGQPHDQTAVQRSNDPGIRARPSR